MDVLPAIVRAVNGRATVLMDSGVRGGTDIVRAVALGAVAVLMGKCFLWSIGALGERGPGHAMDLLLGEARVAGAGWGVDVERGSGGGGAASGGMIWSPNHGDTAFTVPMFDQFMKRIMPGDDWQAVQ